MAFEIVSDTKMNDYNAVFSAIKDEFARFVGTKGLARAGLIPLKDDWNPTRQRGLFRVSAKSIDEAKAVLALIQGINGRKAMARSLGVSGMLKKAREKYLSS